MFVRARNPGQSVHPRLRWAAAYEPELENRSVFHDEEIDLIRRLVTHNPYYNTGTIYSTMNFFHTIRKLSPGSPLIRQLRSQTRKAIFDLLKKRFSAYQLLSTLRRLTHLYII